MDKIYSGARLVAVDLGEKLATTKYLGRGIELLHALTRIPEAPLEPCLAQPKKAYFIRYEDYEKYGLPPTTDRALSILGGYLCLTLVSTSVGCARACVGT
jgi:hypothetical protein